MICELCGREGDDKYFEKHHLFPVKTRRQTEETITVCTTCADEIHLLFTNQELQSKYHTLESLSKAMSDYLKWIKKRPIETHYSMQKKKRKL